VRAVNSYHVPLAGIMTVGPERSIPPCRRARMAHGMVDSVARRRATYHDGASRVRAEPFATTEIDTARWWLD
jgi:hypothetical protein